MLSMLAHSNHINHVDKDYLKHSTHRSGPVGDELRYIKP